MNNALRARLDELNNEIDEARGTAQRAFKRFEEEREAFAKKGITSTSAPEFKRVKDLHEDYEAAAAPVKELEPDPDQPTFAHRARRPHRARCAGAEDQRPRFQARP